MTNKTVLSTETLNGLDSDGRGTAEQPYASVGYALEMHPRADIYVQNQDGLYQQISLSALKKAKKAAELAARKKVKKETKSAVEAVSTRFESIRLADIEPEQRIVANKAKIKELIELRGTRVCVSGWVHRLRVQKNSVFIILRDGKGFLQSVVFGKLASCIEMQTLTLESTIQLFGVVQALPHGKTAPDNHELVVDYFRIIHLAPAGDDAFSNRVSAESDPSHQYDQRHLMLRGETSSAILKVRSVVLSAIRKVYNKLGLTEVTTPCIVQTQCEGGATLFDFNYYGQKAYLTQSSQLYLETCLPALGDVFCVQESFRAEKAHTRRHLSEFTHVEAELGFITIQELLQHTEDFICSLIEILVNDEISGPIIKSLNPQFEPPSRPFLRLDYKDAIHYLQDNEIRTSTGELHKYGDDIAEAAERTMTDKMGKPIFLINFPAHLKAFYMKKISNRPECTESFDLLIPNVGEMIGGSMRIEDLDELLEAYRREGIDPTPYYWFTDQRKYGSCPHGGYGIGLERFLTWLLDRYTVREVCLYPRFTERATP